MRLLTRLLSAEAGWERRAAAHAAFFTVLDCLRGADPGGAAQELEDHLRTLRVMCRLAGRGARPARDRALATES